MSKEEKAVKLTERQFYWLATLGSDPRGSAVVLLARNGTYNPFASAHRSFEALERRGFAEWVNGGDHGSYNGYRITPAGRAALEAKEGGNATGE